MSSKLCLSALLIFILSFDLISQERNCGSMDYLEQQILLNPDIKSKMEEIERQTQLFKHNIQSRNNDIITIPVVVHVVYDVLSKNISDEQVFTQIEVLNKDFRRLNADKTSTWPQADDIQIEFCLAVKDPEGNPTNGITRTNTLRKTFGTNNDVKKTTAGGKDSWPADEYLNIWVCDIRGTVLGFAQFPGGDKNMDGVVIDYQAFGTIGTAKAPFNLGRTTTHEVGHWLNLRHIWGDGDCTKDDFVEDTPTSAGPNYRCALGKTSCGTVDMVANYMDYSDDACMNLFTSGQKSRMRALFSPGGFRHALLNTTACNHKTPEVQTCKQVSVKITFDNYPQETSWSLKDKNGTIILSGSKYSSALRGKSIQIDTCLNTACYEFTISDSYGDGICCKYGQGKYEVSEEGMLLFSGGSFTRSEINTFCIIPSVVPNCHDGIHNGNETGIDCGGSCDPCFSCTDGIQNGEETGIDCGGQDCDPCAAEPNDDENDSPDNPPAAPELLIGSYFESGMDEWQCGGIDCSRYFGIFSWEGDYSMMIRDDSGIQSAMISPLLNITSFQQIEIKFSFYANSMEPQEDFFLMYFDGNVWHTLKSYVSGVDFVNNTFYEASFMMDNSQVDFSSDARFRFQCDASTNSDQVYIDAVRISGISGNLRSNHNYNNTIISLSKYIGSDETSASSNINIYPNPFNDNLYIKSDTEIHNVKIVNNVGQTLRDISLEMNEFELNTLDLLPGIYILILESDQGTTVRKIIKN